MYIDLELPDSKYLSSNEQPKSKCIAMYTIHVCTFLYVSKQLLLMILRI